jgi:GxxExxY protein
MERRAVRRYADEDTGIPARWNATTERVIACAMEVHTRLGPGLAERLYEDALLYELSRAGLAVRRQVVVRVPYKDIVLSELRLDLVVGGGVVVELKCVEHVSDLHLAQLLGYLRAGGMPVGLLINFHTLRLRDGIFRRVWSRGAPVIASETSAPAVTSAFNGEVPGSPTSMGSMA